MLVTLLSGVHISLCFLILLLVLLQHGKGADMGATFGSSVSGSLFGATGSSNFLSRLTAIFMGFFFITALSLTYLESRRATEYSMKSVINDQQPQTLVPVEERHTTERTDTVPVVINEGQDEPFLEETIETISSDISSDPMDDFDYDVSVNSSSELEFIDQGVG